MSTEDKIREILEPFDAGGNVRLRSEAVKALADLMAEARRDELNMLIDGWHPLDGDAGLAPRIVSRIASLAEDSDA